MENFFCFKCNNAFYESSYKMAFRDSKTVYLKKETNKRISCPLCGDIDSVENTVEGDGGIPSFGKFRAMGNDQKRDLLRKRAGSGNKEDRERKEHLSKNFNGKMKQGDY